MLLQLRVTVPPDRTDAVRDLFDRCPGTAHLAVLPGVSPSPRSSRWPDGELGWFGPEVLTVDRPQTGSVTAPDHWSAVVAALAGSRACCR